MAATHDQLSIILTSNRLDRVWAALILAVGAATTGSAVSIFFGFWGLSVLRKRRAPGAGKSFIERMFGWLLPHGPGGMQLSQMNLAGIGPKLMQYIARHKSISSPGELLNTARELGVRFVACQMSMDMLGFSRNELIDGVEYGGVATCLADVRKSGTTLFV